MDSSDPHEPLIGRTVGERWRVVRRIGKGATSVIYEVAHARLPRSFAMKTLAPALAQDTEALSRLRREAEAIAALRHPHIVEIVDWETLDDGTPCIVMELLRGEDLRQRLERTGPLPWPAIGRIADEVLSALSVAHRAGVVHRDLKPANIFLALDDSGGERAKLLDFGISKLRDGDGLHTGDHALGTPLYMSPEQADHRAGEVGPECDVWAMGAILHEMASGRPAFAASSTPAILYRIRHDRPEPLELRRADAPPPFTRVVTRALSLDPEVRLLEAEQLRVEVAASLTANPRPAPPRRGRSWFLPLAVAISAAAVAGLSLAARKRDVVPTAPPVSAPTASPPVAAPPFEAAAAPPLAEQEVAAAHAPLAVPAGAKPPAPTTPPASPARVRAPRHRRAARAGGAAEPAAPSTPGRAPAPHGRAPESDAIPPVLEP